MWACRFISKDDKFIKHLINNAWSQIWKKILFVFFLLIHNWTLYIPNHSAISYLICLLRANIRKKNALHFCNCNELDSSGFDPETLWFMRNPPHRPNFRKLIPTARHLFAYTRENVRCSYKLYPRHWDNIVDASNNRIVSICWYWIIGHFESSHFLASNQKVKKSSTIPDGSSKC